MELVTFDGETKNSTGMQQKQGEESALNSNLAGKEIFLEGHPFTLAGQRFCGFVTWGCKTARLHGIEIPYYGKRNQACF